MIKVLLVEDDDVDADLTQDILAEWSVEQFAITHVVCLGEALYSWTYACRTATGSRPFGKCKLRVPPIIVLSGVSDHTLALQAVQNGAQDYLVKGQGQPELLTRSIRYAMERKRGKSDSCIWRSTII